MRITPRRPSPGNRIFRALLRILPFDFRVEHGRELEQVFQAQRQAARDEGTTRAVAHLWFETVHDLLTTAPRQHAAMLRQDIGYTLRTLRRTPGFTAAAVLTLAIGISGSASIFTIINAFLFRPLPVDRPEELVSIATLGDHHIEMPHGVSFRDLQDYREMTDVFAGMLGYQPRPAWLNAGGRTERIFLEAVTENTFSLLGVRPALAAARGETLVAAGPGSHLAERQRLARVLRGCGRSARVRPSVRRARYRRRSAGCDRQRRARAALVAGREPAGTARTARSEGHSGRSGRCDEDRQVHPGVGNAAGHALPAAGAGATSLGHARDRHGRFAHRPGRHCLA